MRLKRLVKFVFFHSSAILLYSASIINSKPLSFDYGRTSSGHDANLNIIDAVQLLTNALVGNT